MLQQVNIGDEVFMLAGFHAGKKGEIVDIVNTLTCGVFYRILLGRSVFYYVLLKDGNRYQKLLQYIVASRKSF